MDRTATLVVAAALLAAAAAVLSGWLRPPRWAKPGVVFFLLVLLIAGSVAVALMQNDAVADHDVIAPSEPTVTAPTGTTGPPETTTTTSGAAPQSTTEAPGTEQPGTTELVDAPALTSPCDAACLADEYRRISELRRRAALSAIAEMSD